MPRRTARQTDIFRIHNKAFWKLQIDNHAFYQYIVFQIYRIGDSLPLRSIFGHAIDIHFLPNRFRRLLGIGRIIIISIIGFQCNIACWHCIVETTARGNYFSIQCPILEMIPLIGIGTQIHRGTFLIGVSTGDIEIATVRRVAFQKQFVIQLWLRRFFWT